MNQSGWTMQRFDGRTMYIHRSYPPGCSPAKLPFKSNQIKNINKNDEECFLWFLIAYLHPAKFNPERVSNNNKSEYIIEIKLPNVITPL